MGIKDRDANTVSASVVPEVAKARLEHFVGQHRDIESKTYTDQNQAYSGLVNHESVNHSAGEYVRGMVHINGMESFWAILERGYDGTYCHISHGYLHRYVNEFAERHSTRSMDTADMMGMVAENMAGQRLKYFNLFNVRLFKG